MPLGMRPEALISFIKLRARASFGRMFAVVHTVGNLSTIALTASRPYGVHSSCGDVTLAADASVEPCGPVRLETLTNAS